MSPRADVSMTKDEIDAFLSEPRNAVLSTLDRDGAPHAAAMWFVAVDNELRMWTYAKSQKAVNLRRDPRCSLLMEEGLAYNELRGVLVRGRVRFIEDYDSVVEIGRALFSRYGAVAGAGVDLDDAVLSVIQAQGHKRVGLALSLDRIATWDHGRLGS